MPLRSATTVLVAIALAGTVAGPRICEGAERPPNIVFILSDDQSYDTIGALGNRRIATPSLDALVERGFTFTHTYCMGSLSGAVCVPSRAMIHGGRSLFRTPTNLPRGITTLAEALAGAGYRTFGTGKWHNGKAAFARGFADGGVIFFGGMSDHRRVPIFDHQPDGQYPDERRRRGEKFSSELFADAAVEFLRQLDGDTPFFLYVAFTAPHDPRTPPEEFARRYDPGALPLMANFLPEHPFDNGELRIRDEKLAPWPRTPAVVRRHLADYYAMISHMDAQIGRIVAALEESGHGDDTIVVFTSDHGLAVGQHGLLGKQNLYEHSVRVPWIVAGPGVPAGRRSASFAYLLDVFPTICDLVGAPVPASVEGQSQLPVIRGERDALRDEIFTAYKSFQRAVRDRRHKLIRYRVGGEERTQLFDLETDPMETRDLAASPAHQGTREALEERLGRWQRQLDDPLAVAPRPAPAPPPAVIEGRRARYESDWAAATERVWLGPGLFANRLQDWRLRDGRLECVETAENRPLRTVHLLTRFLAAEDGKARTSVTVAPVDADASPSADTLVGFLIGAGGDHVDYRLTAMTHHRPAEDGGLLAVMDGTGRLVFIDNSSAAGGGGLWGIGGKLDPEELARRALFPIVQTGPCFGPDGIEALELRLELEPTAGRYTILLSAHRPRDGELVGSTTVTGVDPALVDGGVALVSHRGPNGARHGWSFRDWRLSGAKVRRADRRAFGPVLATQYTVSRRADAGHTLKLTAQMGPLGAADTQVATLQVQDDPSGTWQNVAATRLVADSFTLPFRVDDWDASADRRFRVVYELRSGPDSRRWTAYEGIIRADPVASDQVVVAAFTGHKVFTGGLRWNHDGIWFPHRDIVDSVRHHRPDLLFFSGDQIYEGDLTPAQYRPEEKALLDYLYKWSRWCWAFGELTREIPSVAIPDDHDVYHGNIWGAGGRATAPGLGAGAQDSGGYKMTPRFVNAVHRTQTSNLPDPVDPAPIARAISVYFTRLELGGVSFAIIADRMFKSAPGPLISDGDVKNGWFQNPEFDPLTGADVPGAVLLGPRQLRFLSAWATDYSRGAFAKVVLSQTIFANVATLPAPARSDGVVPRLPFLPPDGSPDSDIVCADTDSNGWPQTGRNRALRAMRRGFALHIAGDQHLGSTIQYGVDAHGDAGFAMCVPSVANTWPRRWFPPEPGANRRAGAPPYTGDYLDGFGNRMTVHAVSNPRQSGHEPAALHDRAPGYGIVRLHRRTRRFTLECWPRSADPSHPGARPYSGWPVTLHQKQNYGRAAAGWLPTVRVLGPEDSVIEVIDEVTGEIVYAVRMLGGTHAPKIFEPGREYTVRVGEPGGRRVVRSGLRAVVNADEAGSVEIDLR